MIQNIKTKRVFIATYCPNNSVESFYAHSLTETVKLLSINGYDSNAIFLNNFPNSAIAKNEIMFIVSQQEFDSVILIDHNAYWDPNVVLELVQSPYDCAVAPAVNKILDNINFEVDLGQTLEQDSNGWISVQSAATSMMKISQKLLTELNDSNLTITSPSYNEVKNIFEHDTRYGKFFNEGITVCSKIKNLGHEIWLNPKYSVAKIDKNLFNFDFLSSLNNQNIPSNNQQAAEEIKKLYE